MQEEQRGACFTISTSHPLLLIFDQSESVNLLLHRSHLSWARSCSRSRDRLDLWDPGSWESGSITAWASLSFWSLASRRSRARWSDRWHRFTSIGSVVTSLVQGSVGFLEDPSVDIGSVVSFFSSFSSSSSSSFICSFHFFHFTSSSSGWKGGLVDCWQSQSLRSQRLTSAFDSCFWWSYYVRITMDGIVGLSGGYQGHWHILVPTWQTCNSEFFSYIERLWPR